MSAAWVLPEPAGTADADVLLGSSGHGIETSDHLGLAGVRARADGPQERAIPKIQVCYRSIQLYICLHTNMAHANNMHIPFLERNGAKGCGIAMASHHSAVATLAEVLFVFSSKTSRLQSW